LEVVHDRQEPKIRYPPPPCPHQPVVQSAMLTPPPSGGIPHDTFGMTTHGVHTFVLAALREAGLREEEVSKVQTGGPDGDLGSNEIKVSKDKSLAARGRGVIAQDGCDCRRQRRALRPRWYLKDLLSLTPKASTVPSSFASRPFAFPSLILARPSARGDSSSAHPPPPCLTLKVKVDDKDVKLPDGSIVERSPHLPLL
jgi:hypothetical protein